MSIATFYGHNLQPSLPASDKKINVKAGSKLQVVVMCPLDYTTRTARTAIIKCHGHMFLKLLGNSIMEFFSQLTLNENYL